jgi:hypothetical protein
MFNHGCHASIMDFKNQYKFLRIFLKIISISGLYTGQKLINLY